MRFDGLEMNDERRASSHDQGGKDTSPTAKSTGSRSTELNQYTFPGLFTSDFSTCEGRPGALHPQRFAGEPDALRDHGNAGASPTPIRGSTRE
jgi:hypothetical protein